MPYANTADTPDFRDAATPAQGLSARTAAPAGTTRAIAPIVLCLGLAGLPAWAVPARAQQHTALDQPHFATRTYHIDIAADDLGHALARFAGSAGVSVTIPAALVEGKRSAGLNGDFRLMEGFQRLLAGSGLQAVDRGNGTFVIQPAPDAGKDTVLDAVSVTARTDNANVSTEGSGAYAARGATLMKGALSLKEIPQSVTVVTRQRMDDQRLETLDDVLTNTTGITLRKRPGGGSDIYSRGFMTATIQYDGIPLSRGSYWGNTFAGSSVYLDRVEVLRGAQGLLEGAGNPAGAVNVVRKRGLAERRVSVEARAGSWDNYGARLEGGGALDKAGRVRSRVVLDYEDRGYFVDTLGDRNLNAYAALDFDLTPESTLGVGLVHARLKGNRSLYAGVPRYSNGRSLDISRSTYIGADWNHADRKETQVFVDLVHRFNADWRLKIAGAYVKEDWRSVESSGDGTVAMGGSTVPGIGYIYGYGATNAGFDAHLTGNFQWLGRAHDVLLGANYSKQKRNDGYIQWYPHVSYDVFGPNVVPPLGERAPTSMAAATRTPVQKGFYGMLRSHLTDDLTLVLGARASWYQRDDTTTYAATTTRAQARESGEVTPYAGLVYALTPQWSAYASHADIFQPQTATNAQWQVLDPIVGSSHEIGIKGELFDGALNTSLAVFRIDQENRAITDYNAPKICGSAGAGWCSRASGKVRSEGVELEAHGNLTRDWQVSAGYTYNRNEYLTDNDATLVGKPFDFITPKHMLRLWSDYRLPGRLSAWRAGAGANYQSARETRTVTQQGGFSVWNARVAYQIDRNWSAALNINNVFDKRYYAYMDDFFYNSYFGEPRNAMLTLRGSF